MNNDVATFIYASMRGLDARLGPSAGSASLLAVCFHILPAIVQRRVSPGVCTAALLYLPVSSWALAGAARDGVPRTTIVTAAVAGTLVAVRVGLGAGSLSRATGYGG
jgi:hypothetical protein